METGAAPPCCCRLCPEAPPRSVPATKPSLKPCPHLSRASDHRILPLNPISWQLMEPSRTGHCLGYRLTKPKAWTRTPRSVWLVSLPELMGKMPYSGQGFCLFIFFVLCWGAEGYPKTKTTHTKTNKTKQKPSQGLDSKTLTFRTQALDSHVPNFPPNVILLDKFY